MSLRANAKQSNLDRHVATAPRDDTAKMKISAKQYAVSLYEAVQGKDRKDGEVIVRNFFDMLVRDNRTGEMKAIIEQFKKVWNKEKGIVEAEITSAKELDEEILELLNGYIAGLTGAKEVVVSERIDEKILGGAILRFGDTIVDGSLKTILAELKENMAK